MQQDILFSNEDFIFSYRVAGILIHDNKILLQKPKHEQGYSMIGGHIKSLETTEDTLKREYFEELKAEIEIDNLMAVGEIFFKWGNRPCHQISLYYKIHLSDETSIPMDGSFQGYDDLGNERMDLDFCWIPVEELKNGLVVYPLELIPHILNDSKQVVHFVSKQI